jgi:hypothetical protein
MASLTVDSKKKMKELIKQINKGNKYLVDNTLCPQYFNGIDTLPHREYKKYNDNEGIFNDIFKRCFDTEEEYENLFCRANFYKTKNPAKAAHGKIFEDTFNQVIACAFNGEQATTTEIFKANYVLKGKKGNFELPFLKNFFIPQLEWQHDALDLTVEHYNNIESPLKNLDAETDKTDRQKYLLHEKMNYTFETEPSEEIVNIKTEMKKIMGNGLNIKYSKGKQFDDDQMWYPDKAEMADFKNFWDDTHSTDKFNNDNIKILPFIGVWGVWEDIETVSIPQKIHYKCGRGIWFIPFNDNEEFQKKLWGDNSIKSELEKLNTKLKTIQDMSEEIKENPDVYIKSLAIYYGKNKPTSGSAYKIIVENTDLYDQYITKEKSILDVVNDINKTIVTNNGVLKLNQKAFSYDETKKKPFRPARIQVGFIPKKIKEFLKKYGTYVNDKGEIKTDGYTSDDNIEQPLLLSRLLMPIQFTRTEEIQDKAKKTKKAVKQKLKVKIVKQLFSMTKRKKWHTESVTKIKKSTIDEYIEKWNIMDNVKNNGELKIPDNYSTDPFISDKMGQIYNNVEMIVNETSGGGMIGGAKNSFDNDVTELKNIIDKLDDIDLLMDDCQVEDSLIMYDIENELNKYNYIVEKEEQNIGSEEVLYEVKNILVDNRVKLYNQQLKDIPVFIDIDFLIEKCTGDVDETFIDLLKNYSDSLVELYKGINEVQNRSDEEKIELYTAFVTLKEQSERFSSLKGGMRKAIKSPDIEQSLTLAINETYIKLIDDTKKSRPDELHPYIEQLLNDIDITQNPNSEFKKNLWQIFDNLFERLNIDYKLWSEKIIRTRSVSRGRTNSLIKRPSSTESITEELKKIGIGVEEPRRKPVPSINTSNLENVSVSPLTSPALVKAFGFPKDKEGFKLGRTRRLSDAEKLDRTRSLLTPTSKPPAPSKGYLDFPLPGPYKRATSFGDVGVGRVSAPTSPRRLNIIKRGRDDRSTEDSSMRSSNFRTKKKLETKAARDNLLKWAENPNSINLENIVKLITEKIEIGSSQGKGSNQGMSSEGSDTGAIKNVIGLSHLKQSWSSSTSDNLPDEEKLNTHITRLLDSTDTLMGLNFWKQTFLGDVELKKKIIKQINSESVGVDNVEIMKYFNNYVINSIHEGGNFNTIDNLDKLRNIFGMKQFEYETPSSDDSRNLKDSDSDSDNDLTKNKAARRKIVNPKSKFEIGTIIIPKKIQDTFIKKIEKLGIYNVVAQGMILEDFVTYYREQKPKADSVEREKWDDNDIINSWIENAQDTDFFEIFFNEYPDLKGGKKKRKQSKKKKTRKKTKRKKNKKKRKQRKKSKKKKVKK